MGIHVMTFKQKIHHHCLLVIQEKTARLEQVLRGLMESAANETKSTAGDKHETALAMLQAEQARIRDQLQAAKNQKALLEKINPLLQTMAVVNGSLLKTNRGYIFISTALGKITVDGEAVLVISLQSPLGRQLAVAGSSSININGHLYITESIE